jgi:hypothetical protein
MDILSPTLLGEFLSASSRRSVLYHTVPYLKSPARL